MPTKEKSQELTTTTSPSPEVLAKAYAAILDGEPIPAQSDPEIVSRAIVERILNSETFEETFKPQEIEGWREYLGVPVLVRGFHFNPTKYEGDEGGGASVYAVVDLELGTDGSQVTVTCGGRNVLAQLVKMLEKGWLDKPVKLIANETREGYQALWLEAA